jgi:phosphate transport system substrate-binding protein
MFVGTAARAAHAAGSSILGGGSGFAALEIDQWRADTARSPFNLTVNYVAQGSTFGRQQFGGGSFDYGASDIQYQQLELPDLQSRRCRGRTLAQCFVYVPVSAGGLAFMYNLLDNSGNRVNDLKLSRQAACKIFTGAITKWNDPEIVATNPRFASFSRPIKPVVRTDGAGESYVFSEFCIAVVPNVWQAFVAQQKGLGTRDLTPEFLAGQPTSVWPQEGWGDHPVTVASADGTAGYVADPTGGPNAITYVAAGYAKVRSFPTASVQNAAGAFTQPDEDNVTRALGYAQKRGNGTFQLAFNGPDPRAYFPSTYSYVLAQTTGFDPGKGATLAKFLCYAVSQGQVVAPQLRYARLSSVLVNIAIDAIVRIPGAPPAAQCPVAGAPPPPPPPSIVIIVGVVPGATATTVSGAPTPNRGTQGAAGGSTTPGADGNVGGTDNCDPTTTSTATSTTTTTRATTTTTTVPCVAAPGGSTASGTGGAPGSTTEAITATADAELARAAQSTDSQPSSRTTAVWILLAGAVGAFAATTAWGLLRPAR